MRQQSKAYLFALATVLIWSTVASAFKLSLRHISPTGLLLYSSWISAAVLGLLVLLQGKSHWLRHWTRGDYLASLGFALLNPFAYYLILFKAYALLPAQEAQPLNYTWAVTLSVLAVPLLRQRLRLLDLAGLLVSYGGAYVIATRGNVLAVEFSDPLGVGLALGSTLIWALYWIGSTRDGLDPTCRLFVNFCFGAVLVTGYAAWRGALAWPTPPALLGTAYVGIFEMGVTFVLWATALKLSTSAAKVSILIYLSPFLSLVFIRLFVGEAIMGSTLVGLVLIMAGIGLQQLKGK
ncbi:MAG: DMT family transporter [Thermodesulfobacteriota bacterium]